MARLSWICLILSLFGLAPAMAAPEDILHQERHDNIVAYSVASGAYILSRWEKSTDTVSYVLCNKQNGRINLIVSSCDPLFESPKPRVELSEKSAQFILELRAWSEDLKVKGPTWGEVFLHGSGPTANQTALQKLILGTTPNGLGRDFWITQSNMEQTSAVFSDHESLLHLADILTEL